MKDTVAAVDQGGDGEKILSSVLQPDGTAVSPPPSQATQVALPPHSDDAALCSFSLAVGVTPPPSTLDPEVKRFVGPVVYMDRGLSRLLRP